MSRNTGNRVKQKDWRYCFEKEKAQGGAVEDKSWNFSECCWNLGSSLRQWWKVRGEIPSTSHDLVCGG
jgi:hypothetical protein